MGSNDCCSRTPSNAHADQMIRTCEEWLRLPYVKSLIWCHVTKRNDNAKGNMDMAVYNLGRHLSLTAELLHLQTWIDGSTTGNIEG